MRKKSIFIIFLIVLNFLFVKSIFSNVQAASNKLGDVNNNGKIDSADYVLVRSHIIGTKKLTSDQITRADTNSDNKINSTDYVKIRQAIINKTDITPTTTPTPKPTATSLPSATSIEVRFINTINRKSYKEEHDSNDAFVIKTSTGKYILVDTGTGKTKEGTKSDEVKNTIYNELKDMQNNSKVTIDYMIISHMHSDHYGNAINIINDSNYEIKNLILKSESISSVDEKIIKSAKAKKIPITDTNSLKEGKSYDLSSNIKMYLFNVKDVYKGEDCSYEDYVLGFGSSKSKQPYAKVKGESGYEYIYFEGKEYLKDGANTKYHTANKIKVTTATDYIINSTFWVTLGNSGKKAAQCNSNANSIGILFQYKTSKGNKYIYIPSDMQNHGYSHLGEYDSSLKKIIHGHGSSVFYKYTIKDGEYIFELKDGQLVKNTKVKEIKKPSAYTTAKTMVKKFSDLAGNITIYQVSHHGINGYKEVVDTLKINKNTVYAVTPTGLDPAGVKTFARGETVYFMRNSNLMYTGYNQKNGVKCTINSKGTTKCAYY